MVRRFAVRSWFALVFAVGLEVSCTGNAGLQFDKNNPPADVLAAVANEKVAHSWPTQIVVALKNTGYSLEGLRRYLSTSVDNSRFEIVFASTGNGVDLTDTKIIQCDSAETREEVFGLLQKKQEKIIVAKDQEISVQSEQRSIALEPLGASEWGLSAIHVQESWDLQGEKSSKVIVAVIDSGIDFQHPELVGKIVPGYDFVEKDDIPQDTNGHGTHVAGVIAAQLNKIGTVGVAPGSFIMPLKVIAQDGRGNFSDLLNALRYAIDHDAKIINISLGFYADQPNQSEQERLLNNLMALARAKGITVIAAMGNRPLAANERVLPAMSTGVIAVGGYDQALKPAYRFADDRVIYAPGENILSTQCHFWHTSGYRVPCPGVRSHPSNDDYGYMTGTSASAAFVSGAAVLLTIEKPTIAPYEISSYLTNFSIENDLRIDRSLFALKAFMASESPQTQTANPPENAPCSSVDGTGACSSTDNGPLIDVFSASYHSTQLTYLLQLVNNARSRHTFQIVIDAVKQATLGTGETDILRQALIGIRRPGDSFYFEAINGIVYPTAIEGQMSTCVNGDTTPNGCFYQCVPLPANGDYTGGSGANASCLLANSYDAGQYAMALNNSATREYLIAKINAALDNYDFAGALASAIENILILTTQNFVDIGNRIAALTGKANGISAKNTQAENIRALVFALVTAILDKDYPNVIGQKRTALYNSMAQAALDEIQARIENPALCGSCDGNPVRTSSGLKEVNIQDMKVPYGDLGLNISRKHSVLYKNDFSLGKSWYFNYDTRIIVGVKKNADALLDQATAVLNDTNLALQDVAAGEFATEAKMADLRQLADDADQTLASMTDDWNAIESALNYIDTQYDTYKGAPDQIASARNSSIGLLDASGAPQSEKSYIITTYLDPPLNRTNVALAKLSDQKRLGHEKYDSAKQAIDPVALARQVQEIHDRISEVEGYQRQLAALHTQLQAIKIEMESQVAQLDFDARLARANAARNKESIDPANTDYQLFGNGYLKWVDEYGTDRIFILHADGSTTPYDQSTNGIQNKVTLTQNPDLSYSVRTVDGMVYQFGTDGLIRSKTDRNGNRIAFHYDIQQNYSTVNGQIVDNSRFYLSYIEDSYGRKLNFMYDGRHLVQVLDFQGRTVKYQYNGDLLSNVQDQASQATQYEYASTAISKIIDRNGSERNYQYATIDNLQRVVREIDPLGKTWSFQYNFSDRTTDVTNRRGFTTRFISNARGSTLQKIYSDGTREISEYDDRQNLTKRIDANGNATLFEYNSDNLPVKITLPDGASKYLSYDSNGKVTQVTDAMGAVTRIFRDARGNATEVQSPTATTRQIFDTSGLLLQTTDGNGRITTFTYDTYGHLKTMRNPEGGTTYFEFDQVGRMVSKRDTSAPLSDPASTVRIEYDVLDRPVKIINPLAQVTYLAYLPEGQLKQKVEPAAGGVGSRVTTYNYDAANQLTSVIEPEGVTTNLSYDENGNVRARILNGSLSTTVVYDSKDRPLYSSTDGRITRMAYDAVGNVLSTADPLNFTTTFSYDNRYRLVTKTDALSGVTRYEYDAEARLTATIDALNHRTTFSRDAVGRITMVTDPMGGRVNATYDANGNVTHYRNQRGANVDISYNGLNQPVLKTDAMGYRTRYEYDAQGRLRVLTKPDSSVTVFDYDALSRLIKTTNAEGEVQQLAYDEQGNAAQMIDPTGAKWNFSYDKRNRLVRMQNPLGFASTIEYDNFDRRTAVVNAENERTEFTYDKVGNLTRVLAPGNFETSYRYDKLGQPTDKYDAMGRQTQYRYDALRRLTEVVDAAGGVTRYNYDALGNLRRTIDGNGNSTDYTYDANRRLVEERNALNQSTFFNYDAAGNLIRKTNADFTNVDYRYDLDNRPTERQYSDGRVDTFVFDSVGNLVTQKNPDSEESYEYDRVQRVTRVTNLTLGKSFEYGYDLAGRITRIGNPRGGSANLYSYDPTGRLVQSIATDSDGRPNSFVYDRAGRMNRRELANGAVANYTYDATGRLSRLAEQVGATQLVDMQFQYDPAGNITNLTRDGGRYESMTYDNNDRLASYARNGKRVDYTYDAVGNRVRELGSIVTGNGDVSNTYNQLNQLIRRDSLTEGATQFEYDARGNRIVQNDAGQRTQFTYSLENQLTKIKQASGDEYAYRYDAVGRRVYKSFKKYQTQLANGGVGINDPPLEATHMLYDRRQVLYDMSDDKAAKALYHYTPQSDMPYGNLISMKSYDSVNTSIDTLFYHTDHLGTTQKMTDKNGSVRVSYDHDAWGNVISHSGDERSITPAGAPAAINLEPTNRYTYTSKEHEFGTKLTAMDARVYQPQTAQWLQRDPLNMGTVRLPKAVQGMVSKSKFRLDSTHNRPYTYVGGNPLKYKDPTGLESYVVTEPKGWTVPHSYIIIENYDPKTGASLGTYSIFEKRPVEDVGVITFIRDKAVEGYIRNFYSNVNIFNALKMATKSGNQVVQLGTDRQADIKMKAYAKEVAENTHEYRGLSDNCATFVRDTVESSGDSRYEDLGDVWDPDVLHEKLLDARDYGYAEDYYEGEGEW